MDWALAWIKYGLDNWYTIGIGIGTKPVVARIDPWSPAYCISIRDRQNRNRQVFRLYMNKFDLHDDQQWNCVEGGSAGILTF